jgi:hypothetical protein
MQILKFLKSFLACIVRVERFVMLLQRSVLLLHHLHLHNAKQPLHEAACE